MQTQKGFTSELREAVNRLMGDGYRVEVHSIEKVNLGTVHALVILDSDNSVSPNFYIEELYSRYLQGTSTIEKIAEDTVNAYFHNINLLMNENELVMHFEDSGWVKKRFFLQLINNSTNKTLIEDSIHMDFKELSLVLYILVANNKDGISKARVTRALLDKFRWDKKETLDYALENTARLFPFKICPLLKLLQDITGCIDIPSLPDGYSDITVLTNDSGINGATVIFYPDVLKGIAKEHRKSLFLLPSSIHEFLVLEDNGIYNPEKLKDMVQEVNISAVSPEEILSNKIYYYGCNSGLLSVFNDNGELEEIIVP